jgi:hypothetical protein
MDENVGLRGYLVRRDNFEPEESGWYIFPCGSCRHRLNKCDEGPCRTCDHNLSSVPDDRHSAGKE